MMMMMMLMVMMMMMVMVMIDDDGDDGNDGDGDDGNDDGDDDGDGDGDDDGDDGDDDDGDDDDDGSVSILFGDEQDPKLHVFPRPPTAPDGRVLKRRSTSEEIQRFGRRPLGYETCQQG